MVAIRLILIESSRLQLASPDPPFTKAASDEASPMSDTPPPDEAPEAPTAAVSDPAKLIRLGTMIQTLMNEVRQLDTDEEGRKLLAAIHSETMEELGTVLSSDLMEELEEFTACCDQDGVPTESEIRVAQAQLVGWLQGPASGSAGVDGGPPSGSRPATRTATRGPAGSTPSRAGRKGHARPHRHLPVANQDPARH